MAKKAKRSVEPATAKAKKPSGKRTWKMMDRGATMMGGIAARKASAVVWQAALGKKPPTNTRHPELSTREAVAWAIFGGVGSELARVLIRRQTANYWVRSTGHLPPGMKPLTDAAATGQELDPVEEAAARAAKGPQSRRPPKRR